jgi:hypothetical protein
MNIGLVLELLKVSIEVFQDERRDRFMKKYLKLQKDWQDEMALSDNERSDLTLDTILFDCEQLAKLIISEHSKK